MKFLNTSMFPTVAAVPSVRTRRFVPVPSAQVGRARLELRWSRDAHGGGRPVARWQLVPSPQDPGGRRCLPVRRWFGGALRLIA